MIVAVTIVLVVVDLLLAAGNLIHLTADEPHEATHPLFSAPGFDGDRDHSFPEMFGYLKLFASTVLLVVLWRRRGAVFAALALIVAVILIDELLELHERAGWWLSSVADDFSVAGLGPQDAGEIAFWSLAAATLGSVLLLCSRRANAADRRATLQVFGALVLLAFFAIGVDMLNSALAGQLPSLVATALILVENFGELGATTVLLIVIIRIVVLRVRPAARV